MSGVGTGGAADSRSTRPSSVHEGELVLVDVPLDLAAEFRGLHVGRTEVNPGPDAGFEHFVGEIGETIEGALPSPLGHVVTRHADRQ
jgi:hypothetical protein